MIIEKENYYYDGEVLNGVPHGRGVLKTDVSSYSGNFRNGLKDGKGVEVFKDGTKFEGIFLNDMFFDVSGVETKPDGSVIVGNFVNYIPHGLITVQTKDYKYTGYMVNGLKQGKGEVIFKDGLIEKGNFNCDLISSGKKTYIGDILYEGSFVKGVPNGLFESINYGGKHSGCFYFGPVINGKKLLNDKMSKHGYPNGGKYIESKFKKFDIFAWGEHEKSWKFKNKYW